MQCREDWRNNTWVVSSLLLSEFDALDFSELQFLLTICKGHGAMRCFKAEGSWLYYLGCFNLLLLFIPSSLCCGGRVDARTQRISVVCRRCFVVQSTNRVPFLGWRNKTVVPAWREAWTLLTFPSSRRFNFVIASSRHTNVACPESEAQEQQVCVVTSCRCFISSSPRIAKHNLGRRAQSSSIVLVIDASLRVVNGAVDFFRRFTYLVCLSCLPSRSELIGPSTTWAGALGTPSDPAKNADSIWSFRARRPSLVARCAFRFVLFHILLVLLLLA